MNPAAVTARDTLAFMADISIIQTNSYYAQNGRKSVDNTFNINSFVMSFPIWRSSAFMVGINPFSGLGYKFYDNVYDKNLIGDLGAITDYSTGDGTLYEAFVGAGVTFWKRLSLGAQANFYFGDLKKTSARTFGAKEVADLYKYSEVAAASVTGKFGIQYEQPIAKNQKLTLGATYRMAAKLKGNSFSMAYTSQSAVLDTLGTVDTLILQKGNISIPGEISVGLAYNYGDKFHAEFNYSCSDWTRSGMSDGSGFAVKNFSTTFAQSYNVGFEFTPNKNDIRYYMRRVTYRLGAYYMEDYFRFNGQKVSAAAVTMGMTLPVFRWSNGITLGLEFGQRGNMKNDLVRERFVNFSIGMNIYDIWFLKHRYE